MPGFASLSDPLMQGTIGTAERSCTITPENSECESDFSHNYQFTLEPNPLELLTPAEQAPYVGTDSFVLTARLQGVFTNTGELSQSAQVQRSAEVAWSGNITVTYNYNVNEVTETPEPASLALLGAGLGLLGLARRRRRG